MKKHTFPDPLLIIALLAGGFLMLLISSQFTSQFR